jgi:hypothetical protein
MLLGCCHCGETPSESTSASVSQSQSSAAPIQTVTVPSCPAPRCLNDIAPIRYSFTVIDPGGASAVCQASYMGTFTVYHSGSSCFSYLSAERPHKLSGATCVDHTTGERFALSIGGAVFGGNTQFSLQAVYNNGGFNVAIASYSLNAGAQDINCVSSFTLTKGSVDSLGFKFPTTITITPI